MLKMLYLPQKEPSEMSPFHSLFQKKKLVFLDLDGTIYMGDSLIAGAKAFLDFLKGKGIYFYFLSNNSSRSKSDYVKKLSVLGIYTDKEGIILSTDCVIFFARERRQRYLCGRNKIDERHVQRGRFPS